MLTEAREREADRNAQQARTASAQAQSAEDRAKALERELADLKGKKTDRGVVVTLGDVLFDTGKATLKPGAYATIDRLATVLKEDSSRKVMIEGHTDSVGSDEYNQSPVGASRGSPCRQRCSSVASMPRRSARSARARRTPVASNDRPGRPPAEPARGTRVPGRPFQGGIRFRLSSR